MENLARFLSTTLKQLRQQRGWSLSRLAEATGVSKAMLGQIERNESSPTVATLWKIATGLNVPFSTFISPPQSATPSVYDPQQQAMVITSLFPYDPQLCFEHFSIQMASGAISESTPHEKGVIEHVVVIDGQLDLCVDGEWQTLNCGKAFDLLQTSRISIVMVGSKPYIFIPHPLPAQLSGKLFRNVALVAKIAAIFQLLDKNVTVSSHRLELLSPARDAAIAREAILHGADAVYIGGPGFGARHNASNSLKDIAELVPFAHRYGAKIFVTLNTILHDDELEPATADY